MSKESKAERRAKRLQTYERVVANVPRRRKFYVGFIVAAVVVFFVSLADIIWWNEALYWGVLAAYVILFIWAIVLLIARKIAEDEWHLQKASLRCKHCKSIFSFSEEHYRQMEGTQITCPICAEASYLPGPDDDAIILPVPAQPDHRAGYTCENCHEHLLVGTFKKEPKKIRFSQCPNCGVEGMIRPLGETAKLDEKPVLGHVSEDEELEPGGTTEFDIQGSKPKAS